MITASTIEKKKKPLNNFESSRSNSNHTISPQTTFQVIYPHVWKGTGQNTYCLINSWKNHVRDVAPLDSFVPFFCPCVSYAETYLENLHPVEKFCFFFFGSKPMILVALKIFKDRKKKSSKSFSAPLVIWYPKSWSPLKTSLLVRM